MIPAYESLPRNTGLVTKSGCMPNHCNIYKLINVNNIRAWTIINNFGGLFVSFGDGII